MVRNPNIIEASSRKLNILWPYILFAKTMSIFRLVTARYVEYRRRFRWHLLQPKGCDNLACVLRTHLGRNTLPSSSQWCSRPGLFYLSAIFKRRKHVVCVIDRKSDMTRDLNILVDTIVSKYKFVGHSPLTIPSVCKGISIPTAAPLLIKSFWSKKCFENDLWLAEKREIRSIMSAVTIVNHLKEFGYLSAKKWNPASCGWYCGNSTNHALHQLGTQSTQYCKNCQMRSAAMSVDWDVSVGSAAE